MRMATILILCTVAMIAPSCSGDDDVETFTFADDDLCEWVSEVEVAEFVAAEFDWDGTAVVATVEPDLCEWTLSNAPGDTGSVTAGNAATTWRDFDGAPYDFSQLEVIDIDGEVGTLEIGAVVSGHPSLSDGVVVHNGGFGQFAFWVPSHGEYLSLAVSVDDGFWDQDHEARFFSVADLFMQELGWLSGN